MPRGPNQPRGARGPSVMLRAVPAATSPPPGFRQDALLYHGVGGLPADRGDDASLPPTCTQAVLRGAAGGLRVSDLSHSPPDCNELRGASPAPPEPWGPPLPADHARHSPQTGQLGSPYVGSRSSVHAARPQRVTSDGSRAGQSRAALAGSRSSKTAGAGRCSWPPRRTRKCIRSRPGCPRRTAASSGIRSIRPIAALPSLPCRCSWRAWPSGATGQRGPLSAPRCRGRTAARTTRSAGTMCPCRCAAPSRPDTASRKGAGQARVRAPAGWPARAPWDSSLRGLTRSRTCPASSG